MSEIIRTAGAPRCSSIILVWHIATSLCEIKLSQEHGGDGIKSSSSSNPGSLGDNHEVANCLSRYCAYLLVSKPDLLPGNIWMSNKAFQQTVRCAREMLHGCDSLKSKHDKLIPASQEEATLYICNYTAKAAKLAELVACVIRTTARKGVST
uniref:Uncharacterized protein n=1 Tax=Oryza punctata TaxID=4537 RepID=A0A0E0MH93_ORYPU